MSRVTCQVSVSLDGFVAGPRQSPENPIGEGGMRLHDWVFETQSSRAQHGQADGEQSPDVEVIQEVSQGIGAYIMGRRMVRRWGGALGSGLDRMVGRRAPVPSAGIRPHSPPA